METTLNLLKARLGITKKNRDEYLQAIINGILTELKERQGLIIDLVRPDHLMFLVDYATYRYQNVGEESGMPRHLQWRLHNLLVGESR